jgi:hypothetical protein
MTDFAKYERQMSVIASEFRLNVLKRTGISAFSRNQALNSACYKLGWACNLAVERAMQEPFYQLKCFGRGTGSAFTFKKETRTQGDDSTGSRRVEARVFEKENIPQYSYRDTMDYPVSPSETASHANSVLFKSEELCKRVSTLMDRIGSKRQLTLETSAVSTSRLNLHIPDVVLESPMSPLTSISMGDLDSDRQLTQRSNKLQKEISMLERAEKLWEIWKEWKNYVMQRKIVSLKKHIAAKTAHNRRVRLFLVAMQGVVRGRRFKRERTHVASAFYRTRVQAKVMKALQKETVKEQFKDKAEAVCDSRARRKAFGVLKHRARAKIAVRSKLAELEGKRSMRTKFKFLSLLTIQTKIIARESRQKDIAETYDNTKKARLVFRALREATRTGDIQRSKEGKAAYCFFRNSGRKHFKLFRVATKLSAYYHNLLTRAQDYYLDLNYRKGFDSLASLHRTRRSTATLEAKAASHFKEERSFKVLTVLRRRASKHKAQSLKIQRAESHRQRKNALKALQSWAGWAPKQAILKSAKLDWQEAKNARLIQSAFDHWVSQAEDSVVHHQDLLHSSLRNSAKRVLKAWKLKAGALALAKSAEQTSLYKFDKGVARRIFSAWSKAARLQAQRRDNTEQAGLHYMRRQYSKWRTHYRQRELFRHLLDRYGKKSYFYFWATYSARTRLEFRQHKAACAFNAHTLTRKAFEDWAASAKEQRGQRLKEQALQTSDRQRQRTLMRRGLTSLQVDAMTKRKGKTADALASSHFKAAKLAKGFSRWHAKVCSSASRRQLSSRALKGWKRVASKRVVQRELAKNFRDRQVALLCLKLMQCAAKLKLQQLDAKADQFRLSVGLSRWLRHMEEVEASYRSVQRMLTRADEFAEVSALYRGLKRLKANSLKNSLMYRARQHFLESQQRLGLLRWKGYYAGKKGGMYRLQKLKSKVILGLRLQQSLAKDKQRRDQADTATLRTHRLTLWLGRLKAFTAICRTKQERRLTAEGYYAEKLAKKTLRGLVIGSHNLHKSEALLPKLFYWFCQRRTVKNMSEDELPEEVLTDLLYKVQATTSDPRINAYAKVLSFKLPQHKAPCSLGRLFCCWKTAASVNRVVKQSRADEANRWRLMTSSWRSWRKVAVLHKVRMRTLSTAVLFHRFKLRHRAMRGWKRQLRKVSFK